MTSHRRTRSLLLTVVMALLVLPAVAAEVPDQLASPKNQSAAADKPVKVFILAGQSNMEGHGKVEWGRDPNYDPEKPGAKREILGGLGCLRHLVTDPKTADQYNHLVDADGKWVVRDDVWILSTTNGGEKGRLTVGFGAGPWIGPEFGFGHVVGDRIDGPVLIIKTAWGGKSLAIDFRPASSGKPPYAKTKYEPEQLGKYYREMMSVVKDVRDNLDQYFPELAGRELQFAGFGWHQGWNDGGEEMVEEYEKNLVHLIHDVRRDLGSKDLPFVIANTGMIGWEGKGGRARICESQLAVGDAKEHPEFAGTVASVETRGFDRTVEQSPSHFGYHWKHNGESHYLIGEAMGQAMLRLIDLEKEMNIQAPDKIRK